MTQEINGTGLTNEMINESVDWFACHMKNKLYKNIHKGGWDICTVNYLYYKALDELEEVFKALAEGKPASEIVDECAGVANFVMMIADRVGNNVD